MLKSFLRMWQRAATCVCLIAGLGTLAACANAVTAVVADTADSGGAAIGVIVQGVSTETTVSRVHLTVTAVDIGVPLESELTLSNGVWQASLANIPAGTNRTFKADAFDSSNVLLFSGSVAGQTIVSGQTMAITIILQPLATPSQFVNTVPYINSLVLSTNTVAPGGTVNLLVNASDVDPGDTLTYLWSVPNSGNDSNFSTPTQSSTVWTAPNRNGVFRITIQVTDSRGAVNQASVSIVVNSIYTSPKVNVTAQINYWPEVTQLTATNGRLNVGDATDLTVVATSADGDTLTYAWTSPDPGCETGVFSRTDRAKVTWTAPTTVPTSGLCTLAVKITDGKGGENTGSIKIQVGTRTTVNVPPVIIDSSGPTTLKVSQRGTFSINVASYDPNTVQFTWTSDGTDSTAFDQKTDSATNGTSSVRWLAPKTAGTYHITVTVKDFNNLPVSYTFTIVVS